MKRTTRHDCLKTVPIPSLTKLSAEVENKVRQAVEPIHWTEELESQYIRWQTTNLLS